ncbi:nitroreductase [Candidatus Bathyarchaeota archaeon]|nr:nitroreductase [Candidatus Bathyarchaeota archaeon]
MSVSETIRTRSSWRTYNNKPFNRDDLLELEKFISSDPTPPFGNTPRFKIIEKTPESRQLGTYGFIHGATNFIIGAISDAHMALQDYGYSLERIILRATEMGLGTCWLGGTFTRSAFSEELGLAEGEVMPAITPVGYVKKDRRLVERAMRWAVKAKERKPWKELFFDSFMSPLDLDTAGVYGEAFENVRLGPSAHNGQPWRLVLDEDKVHFYATGGRNKTYSSMQRLDMGIAFSHFELTMREKGAIGEWSISNPEITDSFEYVATWSN